MDTRTVTIDLVEREAKLARSAGRCFLLAPVATLVGTFLLVLLGGIPGKLSLVFIPLTVIVSSSVFIGLIGFSTWLAIRKKAHEAASLFVAAVLPMILMQPITWVADCAHLGLTIGFGIGAINGSALQADPQFVTYDWSVGLAGGPVRLLIFDATDDIARPPAQLSGHLLSREGVIEACEGKVSRLLGHYYVCSF